MSQSNVDDHASAAMEDSLPQLARPPIHRKKPHRITPDEARRLFDEYMRGRENCRGLVGVLSRAYNVSRQQTLRVVARLSLTEENGEPACWLAPAPRRDSPIGDVRRSQAIVLLIARDPTITLDEFQDNLRVGVPLPASPGQGAAGDRACPSPRRPFPP